MKEMSGAQLIALSAAVSIKIAEDFNDTDELRITGDVLAAVGASLVTIADKRDMEKQQAPDTNGRQ